MKRLGRHILAEFFDCRADVLKNKQALDRILREAVEKADATVVSHTSHSFSASGVSAVMVIAESHVTIHTWPEHKYVAADIFVCGAKVDPWIIQRYLHRSLESENVSAMEISRGVFNQPGDDAP